MTLTHISRRFSLSLVLLLATLGISLLAPTANATFLQQTQKSTEVPVSFEEEDGLRDDNGGSVYGFNTIYVDSQGNVLGTFVNVPGAKIKVYADGHIELISRDYTTELDYYADGDIRSIGNARFRYSRNGRIQKIDDTEFRYSSRGILRRIGNTDFNYSSRGRLQKIDDVGFDYDRDGILERIDDDETRDGIRIIVVN